MSRIVPIEHVLTLYRDGDDRGWDGELAYLRAHHALKLERLMASIREHGIREPILLGADGRVWDGHHRLCAAMLLELEEVPVAFSGEEAVTPAVRAKVYRRRVRRERPEDWEAMQERNRARTRPTPSRTTLTEAQKERRRERDRQRRKDLLANETPEEREARLEKRRAQRRGEAPKPRPGYKPRPDRYSYLDEYLHLVPQ